MLITIGVSLRKDKIIKVTSTNPKTKERTFRQGIHSIFSWSDSSDELYGIGGHVGALFLA